MTGRLDGTTAVVTGASSGIGNATARALAQARQQLFEIRVGGKSRVHGREKRGAPAEIPKLAA